MFKLASWMRFVLSQKDNTARTICGIYRLGRTFFMRNKLFGGSYDRHLHHAMAATNVDLPHSWSEHE